MIRDFLCHGIAVRIFSPSGIRVKQKIKGSDRKSDYAIAGYCGYRCDRCPGLSEDRNMQRKMADEWINKSKPIDALLYSNNIRICHTPLMPEVASKTFESRSRALFEHHHQYHGRAKQL